MMTDAACLQLHRRHLSCASVKSEARVSMFTVHKIRLRHAQSPELYSDVNRETVREIYCVLSPVFKAF